MENDKHYKDMGVRPIGTQSPEENHLSQPITPNKLSEAAQIVKIRNDLSTATNQSSTTYGGTDTEHPLSSDTFHTVRHEYDFGRGKITTIRVTPEIQKRSERQEEQPPPLVFAHGYSQDETLQRYLELFAQVGERETIGIIATGRRKIKLGSEKIPIRTAKGQEDVVLPAYQVDKARDIIGAIEALDIDKAVIVGTSEGAQSAAIAAALDQNRFEHVILVHPAGMGEHKIPLTLGIRMAHQVIRRLKDIRTHRRRSKELVEIKQKKHTIKTALKHPGQIIAEGVAVGFGRINQLVPILGKRLAIAAGEGDVIYPPNRLKKQLGENKQAIFRFFTTNGGGHGIDQRRETIHQIVAVLGEMEHPNLDL